MWQNQNALVPFITVSPFRIKNKKIEEAGKWEHELTSFQNLRLIVDMAAIND